MKAAVVVEAGQTPVFGDFGDPVASPGKSLVRVTASAISHLTRNRASGAHYSSDDVPPFVPGVDGTGTTEDGRRVYFLSPEKPFGAMAEYSLVDDRHLATLPDGLDDVTAAAMAIPAMSSWAALVERAHVRDGETILVNGATGASGRLAIQIAKQFGAKKIIATGRQSPSFDDLNRLGADVTIPLVEDPDALAAAFRSEFEQGIDIVLDYLWGASAGALIRAASKGGPEGVPIRYVQIGSISGENINLPGASLRSGGLQLMGSGFGSVPFPNLLKSIQGALNAAPSAGFEITAEPEPLADVSKVWAPGSDGRVVLVP